MRARVEIVAPGYVYEALGPVLDTAPGDGTAVEMCHSEGRLQLSVESEDPSSMRAALNTWLRLAKVALESGDTS